MLDGLRVVSVEFEKLLPLLVDASDGLAGGGEDVVFASASGGHQFGHFFVHRSSFKDLVEVSLLEVVGLDGGC